MQIILIQSEIEQSIKDYISKRLTVAEGTDIQIDLSATRGAEGIKAIIDLVPATPVTHVLSVGSAKKTSATPKLVNQADAPAAKEVAKAEHIKTPTVVVVSGPAVVAEVAPAASEMTQDESEVEEADQDTTEATQPQAETEVEEVAAAPATPPVRSLFANLRKPVNVSA